MRRITILSAVGVALWLCLCGRESPAQDGAYVLRVEAPFTNNAPSWLPLRVSVQVKDGKPVPFGSSPTATART